MSEPRLPADEELARLLGSVRAQADPALWTRVRARISERERAGRLTVWLSQPRALVASLALCVTGFALAFVLARSAESTAGDDPASLAIALQAAVEGSDVIGAADATATTTDSGGLQ